MVDPKRPWADEEEEPDEEETEEEEEQGEGPPKGVTERLLESRTVLLAQPVTPELGEDIVARLLLLDDDDPEAPINVYINSPGGSVDTGFAIYDMMRFIEAPVRCIANGLCASAGVIILLGAPKESRLSLPNSRFMIHQPSGGAHGSVEDIKIEADEILKIRRKINEQIAAETGQDFETVEHDTRRNRWLSADEAIEYGLIERIVATKKDLNSD
jgi:ATP-dependent Clp protease protease subunit